MTAQNAAPESHGSLSQLFSGQSSEYAKFRPRYTGSSVYEAVLEYAQLPHRGLAVDLGCGSGQATADLASMFDRVIGIDASAEQLRHAEQRPNVEYRQRAVEDTGLPPQSVDLVTAATALHWFDVQAVYREARRVLKPGGAFAAWSYSGMQERYVPRNPAAERLREALRDEFLPFMHPRLQHFLFHMYQGCEPNTADFAESKRMQIDMQFEMTVAQMVGWTRSWSAYLPYVAKHGEEAAEKLLQHFRQDMLEALGIQDEHTPVKVVWEVDVLLARLPQPLPPAE